ncbi:MAG: type IV prepilin peptidase [Lachnospiraceae bacterium]
MHKYLLLGLLMSCAVEDYRKKEMTLTYLLLFGIAGLLLHLCNPICSIFSILWGMLLGAGMILISMLSRGNVGLGDGILLIITGIYLGGNENLELLCIGLALAGCWSLGLLFFGKKGKKDKIAFAPFLLIAYVTMLMGNYGNLS